MEEFQIGARPLKGVSTYINHFVMGLLPVNAPPQSCQAAQFSAGSCYDFAICPFPCLLPFLLSLVSLELPRAEMSLLFVPNR